MAKSACVVLWALYNDWVALRQAAHDNCDKLVVMKTCLMPPLEAFLFVYFERVVADALPADITRTHRRCRRAAATLLLHNKSAYPVLVVVVCGRIITLLSSLSTAGFGITLLPADIPTLTQFNM